MDPSTHHNLFSIQHLCMLTLVTWKLQVAYGCCTYRMTAWVSEMSIFALKLDVRYDWRVMAPSTCCSFFSISHLCVLTHITWKLQVIFGRSAYQMIALLSETFLAWFTVAREFNWRATAPETHQSFSDATLCVYIYCKPVHISLFNAQLHRIAKLMYLMTAYYTRGKNFL